MDQITRRGLGALGFAALASEAFAKAPAIKSAWPDATETVAMIRGGQLSALEATKAAIDRTLKLQPKLNFVVASDFDRALKRAAVGGKTGPFGGVPFFVKDLDDYVGLPTRVGSRAFLPLPPATKQDALIDAFEASGVNVLGKSATPEAGFLPTTEPFAFGATRNPWDVSRSSGGSSGGAAAAVASGAVTIAHASDGGGSIRIPASCCGLFGLKPSRYRMVGTRDERPLSLGVNHVVTRSIRDSAAMFAAIEDNRPGSRHPPVGLVTTPLKRKLRVGLLIDSYAGKAPSAEIKAATESSAALMRELGHTVVPAKWPIGTNFLNDFLLMWAEGAADFADTIAKIAGRPADGDLLEPFSLGLVEMWRRAPKAEIPQVFDRLQKAALAYDPWFVSNRFDVVMSPVLGWAPPPIGEVGPAVPFDTLVERLIDYVGYTTYHNVAGGPSMSVPLNWTPQSATGGGLPVGTQFAARVGGEGLLFQLAYQLEAARPWADKAPPVRA